MRSCYIFDLDRTIADDAHRAHHLEGTHKDFDVYFSLCENDKPIEHIITLMRHLSAQAYIWIFTGRSEMVENETRRWLARHDVRYDGMKMRKQGDFRANSVVKLEMLAEISAWYKPIMAFDDQISAVRAWREAGVPCMQVMDSEYVG